MIVAGRLIGNLTKSGIAMRRSNVSDASPLAFEANPRHELPSNSVIDMIGRLFGVVLATLFERCEGKLGKTLDGHDDLQSLMRELLNGLIATERSNEERSSGQMISVCEMEGRKGDEELSDIFEKEESELLELKRRLWKDSKSKREDSDRSVDLIRHSTSLLDGGGDCVYHICPFGQKQVFEGLIHVLGQFCGGNPHDKGIICATGTPGNDHPSYQPKNAADLQTDSYFCSRNATDQWMSYDFKDMRVAVTHYILRSNGQNTGDNHLRSWVMEGSEDGGKWVELDRRDNEGRLNGPKSICSFEMRTVIERRFIRLRGTGPTWNGTNYVYFEAFDVFGGLRMPNSVKLV
jgi:hypothetical protein